jgi:Mrp family chromosome partitioning ATPase
MRSSVLDPTSLIDVQNILWELSQTSQIVIVDAPPLFDATTLELSIHVDALLLVARLGVVDRKAMTEAKRLIGMSPAPAIGMVITSADTDPDGRVASYAPNRQRR